VTVTALKPHHVEPQDTPAPRILRPGDNCWRIEHAHRAAVLVDGCEYYRRLDQALRGAQRSIMIVGWDFDGAIKLRPDQPDAPSLGELLRELVEARPELEVRILIWSVAVVHAPGDPMALLLGADWENHPRIQVRLDRQHPIYGAHHQKIVSIDGALAFVGGMDLTIERWDTPCHEADDPLRLRPDGKPYTPVHDLQMVVDGDAAKAIGELVRHRWRVGTGEDVPPQESGQAPWPADLAPEFSNTRIAIARTAPAWAEHPAVGEIANLTNDAIAAAQSCIYIEAQYLTAHRIGNLLAGTLSLRKGPEIVILLTSSSHGLVEHFVMGTNRDRLLRKLRRADSHGRLRVLYPVVPRGDGFCEVLVHAKLMIIDNSFVRIGSANLNNRSMGLDTECDLAIEASRPDEAQAIARLRDRLLAEHLDATPDLVAETVRAEGSLVRAIDRLNGRPRQLRPFPAMNESGPTRPLLGTGMFDPRRPFEPFWFLRRRGKKRR
jgi:phosphatidylserine/phosphatidylglycerophosphate/cardiolipin synthase-like enzyme